MRWIAYCGLITSFDDRYARDLRAGHFSICAHHVCSDFLSEWMACVRQRRTMSSSRWAQSPTAGMSTFTFLLIDDGSMSTCIFLDPGEKASSRPVMRSSKRAPMQIMTSQSCIAMLASSVPCMPSMPSHFESAAGNAPSPINVEVIVLGARPGDADRVALLESIIADQVRGDLAGDTHDRNRIAERVRQAGHGIGRPGARCDQHAADLAGRARIAFRRVHRALLVPNENVAHLILRENGIIDRQHRTARIAEQMFDVLVGKRLDDHFGAGHFACHVISLSSSRLWVLRQ